MGTISRKGTMIAWVILTIINLLVVVGTILAVFTVRSQSPSSDYQGYSKTPMAKSSLNTLMGLRTSSNLKRHKPSREILAARATREIRAKLVQPAKMELMARMGNHLQRATL